MKHTISHTALLAGATLALSIGAAFSEPVSDPNWTYPGVFGTTAFPGAPIYVTGHDGSPTGNISLLGNTYVLQDKDGNLVTDPTKAPGGVPLEGYKWVPATYETLATAQGVTPYTKDGKYYVNKYGSILPSSAASIPSDYAAVDPKAQVPASQNNVGGYVSYSGATGLALSNGVTSTAFATSGVYIGNAKGSAALASKDGEAPLLTIKGTGSSSTVVGAGGLVTVDGTNTAVVTPTAVGVGNKNGAAGAVVDSNGQPGLAVYGPTAAPVFSASADGSISAYGNRIQDVGTPIAPHDATNKAYVDSGLRAGKEYADQGAALAMALASPDRKGNETWALNIVESFKGDKYATGLNGIIEIANTGAYTFSLGGGVSFSDSEVAGRVVGQIAGGGGYVPLK